MFPHWRVQTFSTSHFCRHKGPGPFLGTVVPGSAVCYWQLRSLKSKRLNTQLQTLISNTAIKFQNSIFLWCHFPTQRKLSVSPGSKSSNNNIVLAPKSSPCFQMAACLSQCLIPLVPVPVKWILLLKNPNNDLSQQQQANTVTTVCLEAVYTMIIESQNHR